MSGGLPISSDLPVMPDPAILASHVSPLRGYASQPGTIVADVYGVVLFADVTGFTELVNEYAESGDRGAEQVQGLLNELFEQIICEVCPRGGEVVCFPGDAVLAFWSVTDADQPEMAVLQAASAAVCAARNLEQLSFRKKRPLKIRTVVSTGSFSVASVGGHNNQWHLVLSGGTLPEIGPMLKETGAGEILFDTLATTQLRKVIKTESAGTRLRIRHLDPQFVTPKSEESPHPAPSTQELHAYIPEWVRTRYEVGHQGWIAEFRTVTTVFVSIDQWRSLTDVQKMILGIQQCASRYAGAFTQVVQDDKGLVVLVAFGVPGHAHENDALRAVRCAMDMHTELPLSSHIGIATGRVFCGLRGSKERREFAVIGPSVNMAARLMSAAESILCDRSTETRAREGYYFEYCSPIVPKRGSELLQNYRPIGTRDPRKTAGVTIPAGRAVECGLIDQMLRQHEKSPQGRLLILEGSAGVGKSRMVEFVLERLQTTAMRAFVGYTDAIENNTAYLAWRPIVSSLLLLDEQSSVEQVTEALLNLLGEEARDILPLLNPVLPISVPDTGLSDKLHAVARSEATRELLVRLIEQGIRQAPTVVFLEDIHWLDPASVKFVESLMKLVPDVFIVATRRIEAFNPFENLAADDRKVVLSLGDLERDAAQMMLCEVMNVDSIPREVADYIYSRTSGHPLFCREFATLLRSHAGIKIEGGECIFEGSIKDLEDLTLSESVNGLLVSRIDRLPPDIQLTLKVASVIGHRFTLDALAAVHPLERSQKSLFADLSALVHHELLVSEAEGHIFRHALIRDAVYEMIPFEQRSQLHGGIGRWLETAHSADLERNFGLLAYHFEGAGDVSNTINYLDRAGRQALERDYSNVAAVEIFERLLALYLSTDQNQTEAGHQNASHDIQHARWERSLAEALFNEGRHRDALPHLERSLSLLQRKFPGTRAQGIVTLLKGILIRLIIKPKPAKPPVDAPEVLELYREAVAAYERYTRACHTLGRTMEGAASSIFALTLSEKLGPSKEFCSSYSMFANVIANGSITLATRYRELAIEAAESIDDPAALAVSLSLGNVYRLTRGEWQIKPQIEQALDLYDQIGDHYNWASYAVGLSRIELLCGDYSRCLTVTDQALIRARASAATGIEIWLMGSKGDALFRMGELQAARVQYQATLDLIESTGSVDEGSRFHVNGGLALVAVRDGNQKEARRFLEAGIAAMEKGWATFNPQHAVMGVAEALFLLAPESGEINKLLNQFLRKIKKRGMNKPVMVPLVRLYSGWAYAAAGNVGAAKKLFESAIEACDSLDLPFETAYCKTTQARLLGSGKFTQLLEEGIAGFDTIGAQAEANRARQDLAYGD